MGSKFNKVDYKNLSIDQKLKIGNEMYSVYGFISYKAIDKDYEFIEYELIPEDNSLSSLWLSVGVTEDYTQLSKRVSNKSEEVLQEDGYILTEDILAKVTTAGESNHLNKNGVMISDEVGFKTYESSEEVISIEVWRDEDGFIENIYYYEKADMVDIEVFEFEGPKSQKVNFTIMKNTYKGLGIGCISIIILAIVAFIAFVILPKFSNKNIKGYLEDEKNYAYYTSLTSNADDELEADLYLTNLSVDEAAKDILSEVGKKIKRSQGLEESLLDLIFFMDTEYAVAMLTEDEYAIVYEGIDDFTYIQVSPREYNYVSNSDLFESINEEDSEYYHDFYYTYSYEKDKKEFGDKSSAHDTSDRSKILDDPDNEYYVNRLK